ncbi:tetratricopeptide repeat protein [Paracrocinitomix mangrovi]|uniref:tetratricopeptide repeat protein n=1 Tax=Paracrocinitomix mangrovi TaxID=2862509 RepID=UPI001C8EC18F|nr:tetratricopeptide repeat protein [Paracrocinitomix mangrovi]UKN03084.1 tetratricopeptide repeat protein [Paracrocinitomix mangrovi]
MFDDDEEEDGFDSQFYSELERFEKMLEDKEAYYFDSEILEQIIDHFIIKNQLKKGLTAIEFAQDQHPNNNTFELRKAQIFSTTGKLKESLLILQQLEKNEPFNTEVYVTKASVFSQLRDHENAIKYFEKAIDIASDQEEDWEVEDIRFDLALEYESIHDYNNAIKELKKLLQASPENESAIYEIAYCYERIGDFDKCIEYYQMYIDNNPYSFTAWYNLGNIYFLKNNVEKALWAYDYSTIINEEFSSAYFNMGNTYMQIGEYQKALTAYAKCIDIDGDDALTLSYLAEAYERLERYDEALEYYEKSKSINDELAEPWLGIGIIKELQGFTTEAIQYLQRAAELQPENANYRLVLAEALYKAERFIEAENELETALQSDPKYAEAIILLARIKAEFSIEDAVDYIASLEHLSDLDSSVRIFFSVLLWQNGQKTESLLVFKKEYLIDANSAKTLFLHFPEAQEIPEFLQILDLNND